MIRTYHVLSGDPVRNIPGWPHVVVEDKHDRVVLFLPHGSPIRRWDIREGRFRPAREAQGDSLRVLFPGKPYEVSLYYETGKGPARHLDYYFPEGTGPFYGWKVDLVAPFRRNAAGFDAFDEVLDIIVNPDRRYRWKDEDQMQQLIGLGIYTEALAEEIRADGRNVIELIEAGKPPFDDEWVDWRPPEDLVLKPAPDGWQFLPTPEIER
jgi:hypothetical protein